MKEFESWFEEKRSAFLYHLVAQKESDPNYQKLFLNLAESAERQADLWLEQLKKQGKTLPSSFQPDFRTRVVAFLIQRLGPQRTRTILAAMKVRGMSVYLEAPAFHPMPRSVSDIEQHHNNFSTGTNLRAAVFGMNDGLISNASLILGVAAATQDPHFIILSGIAGMLAGAFSMGAGEYVSVRSQRELFEYQIELEQKELEAYPEEEAEELALIYEARGLPKDEARRVAKVLIQNPAKALDTLAREELGLNPNDLGSPLGAGIASLLSFAVGAFIPLLPFFFPHTFPTLLFSIGLTGLSLFSVGSVLSLFTNRSAWWGGLRMLLIGAAAGIATYSIGMLMGVALH